MKEYKISELFDNPNTVYVFDVDGVLAPLEFGEYNHYELNDDDWAKALLESDLYANKRSSKTFQKFLATKNKNNVYVATKVMNEREKEQKINFLNKNYGILKDHVFEVYKNEEKLEVIKNLKKLYPDLEDKYFVMIDDTVDVLNHIMFNSAFSTVHVSTFIE